MIRRSIEARSRCGSRTGAGLEQGYTLLLALFIGALMLIAASVAVPSLIIQSRRQKEALLIWRGQQYARAIGLFYRKTGRLPHDLDDLDHGVGNVHFLRKAYKDPINDQDGSWRLIYVGQGGVLMGSLRWHTVAEFEAAAMGIEPPGSKAAGVAGAQPGGPAAQPGSPTAGESQTSAPDAGPANPSGQTSPSPASSSSPSSSSASQPQGQIIEEGSVVGGNLVGVASKVNHDSLKTYFGASNYQKWEFIWNPFEGQGNGGVAPGALPGGQPGAPKTPMPFGMPEHPGAAITPGPGH